MKNNFNKMKKKSKEWGSNWERKKNSINFDWIMKLKANKTWTKIPRKKIKNQKNKYQNKKITYEKL
jgi:hypothetical protein